jgi:type I restriction enzyme S subunit
MATRRPAASSSTTDPRFWSGLAKPVLALLRSHPEGLLRSELDAWAAATTFPAFRPEVLSEMEIEIPDLSTQKKIAEILSAYDSKIENNNKIIKNLEATAQAIFDEWFINFRFPGYEKVKIIEGEMGEIPTGWEVKSVLDVIERIPVGKKFENKTASPIGKVPILDQGASGFIGYHNEEPGVEASIENPVVVFTNHTCYYRLLTEPFSCIQNVLPYIGKNGYKTLFVYFLTKEKIKMSEYKGHWPEFEQQVFVIPPVELANSFVSKIKSFVSEMVVLEKENVKLKESRDQLLAKLI